MKNYFLLLAVIVLTAGINTTKAQTPTAKLVFSKTINGAAETSFSSSDYIYARIEFAGGTLDDYYGISALNYKNPSLTTKIWVNLNGNDMQGHPWQELLLNESDKDKTVFSFDILPEPSKATSLIVFSSAVRAGVSNSTFANSVGDRIFSKEGVYTVEVLVSGEAKDAWGKRTKDIELKGTFKFDFHFADIQKMAKNKKEADALIKSTAFKLDKLPEIFTKNIQANDPKLTRAKIAAILKRDIPGRNIVKFAIGKHNTVWKIMKNDFGIPRYRYFEGDIHFISKDGNECKVDAVYLREDYIGGGKYGTLKVGGGGGGSPQLIDCTVVK